MTKTQYIVVWAWLFVTGMGLVLTATMMYLSWSDYRFLQSHHVDDEAVLESTKLGFWQESRRFVVKLCLFLLGVEAFFAPPRPDPPPRQTISAWLLTAALFGVVLLLNYSTFAAMRYRHKFLSGSRAPSREAQNEAMLTGMEQLHQDNVESAKNQEQLHEDNILDASTLLDADKSTTRHVKQRGVAQVELTRRERKARAEAELDAIEREKERGDPGS